MEHVILVDALDREIGTEEKLAAHQKGLLHRAVSVVLIHPEGKHLMQQRALSKYHSGGLWSNTCCGHPRPGETPLEAAQRRLWEEMGIRCALTPQGKFLYQTALANDLIEHEFDHLFIGSYDGLIAPNPEEVAAWVWQDPHVLHQDLLDSPARYTAWLPLILSQLESMIKKS